MNNTLHIAGREFSDNARTKGFWINLLMFPVILFASVKVPQLLEEKAKPTRHFVLVDQSGELGGVVDAGLDRYYRRELFRKLSEYLQTYMVAAEVEGEDASPNMADMMEKLPADAFQMDMSGDMTASILDMLDDYDPRMMAALGDPDALAAMLEFMKPKMKEGAPDFEAPRRMLERTEMPASEWGEIDPLTASKDDIVAHMKPYLLDKQKFSDHKDPLFALVIIPPDALQRLKGTGKPMIDPLEAPKLGVQFWSTNLTDKDLAQVIESSLNREVQERELAARGLDGNEVSAAQSTKMLFASFDPKKAIG